MALSPTAKVIAIASGVYIETATANSLGDPLVVPSQRQIGFAGLFPELYHALTLNLPLELWS